MSDSTRPGALLRVSFVTIRDTLLPSGIQLSMQLRQHLPDEGFIHRTLDSRLVESRCRQCGLIVAASQSHWILELAESQHTCPVYLNYGYTGEAERIKPH